MAHTGAPYCCFLGRDDYFMSSMETGQYGAIRGHGGQQVNGWAVWQWANISVTLEAHAVWESPEGMLADITPHDCGEREILFLRDDRVVYSGKPIGSIRQPLTASPQVAELIGLLNERDRIMSAAPGRLCEMPKSLLIRIMQIQEDRKSVV